MSITIGLTTGERVVIDKEIVLIGLDDHCDVQPTGPGDLNARHARIKKIGGRWLIESLGDWPLQIDGEAPTRAGWLRPGDVVQLAPYGPSIIFEPLPPSRSSAPASRSLAAAPRAVVSADPADSAALVLETATASRQSASGYPMVVWALLGLIVVGGFLSYKGYTLREFVPDFTNYRAEMLAFRDDASAFTGRTLTGEMTCESAGDGLADTLRANPPGIVVLRFQVRTSAGFFPMRLRVPTTLKTPNADAWEPLLVTFRCDDGNLNTGNVALEIRRK